MLDAAFPGEERRTTRFPIETRVRVAYVWNNGPVLREAVCRLYAGTPKPDLASQIWLANLNTVLFALRIAGTSWREEAWEAEVFRAIRKICGLEHPLWEQVMEPAFDLFRAVNRMHTRMHQQKLPSEDPLHEEAHQAIQISGALAFRDQVPWAD